MCNSKYKNALSIIPDFAEIAEICTDEKADVFSKITSYVTAPVLYSYVLWTLRKAQNLNLNKLWFLARDGHILYNIAKILCNKYNIPIKCHYYYCSRMALRMPVYHLMGNSAYDILLIRGASLTPDHVLKRLNLNDNECSLIYNEINFPLSNKNKILSRSEFSAFSDKIRKSKVFSSFLKEKSTSSLENAISYAKQEGLLDSEHIGIVDSGWNGSMQNSLYLLLEYARKSVPKITGFYFGLYSPPEKKAGDWFTWYFEPDSPPKQILKFNNNVYECMCYAPHGTTIGYMKKDDKKIIPICKKLKNIDLHNVEIAKKQEKICIEFANKISDKSNFNSFKLKDLHKMSTLLLQQFMFNPDKEEALAFSEFLFCDDLGENYFFPLVQKNQENVLKNCLFTKRIKQFFLRSKEINPDPFWIYGSLNCSNIKLKSWYRKNFYLWDLIRLYNRRK